MGRAHSSGGGVSAWALKGQGVQIWGERKKNDLG